MSQEYCIQCDSKMMYDEDYNLVCPNCYTEDFYYKEEEEYQ